MGRKEDMETAWRYSYGSVKRICQEYHYNIRSYINGNYNMNLGERTCRWEKMHVRKQLFQKWLGSGLKVLNKEFPAEWMESKVKAEWIRHEGILKGINWRFVLNDNEIELLICYNGIQSKNNGYVLE